MYKVAKIILCVILSISLLNSNVYAKDNNNKKYNIEELNLKEQNIIIDGIIDGIINNNQSRIREYRDYIIADTYARLNKYSKNNKIEKGNIISNLYEITYPDNSSSGDTVIMKNITITYNKYNLMYLFEFHINKEGIIYGYNVWVY